jgi:hypothetical protein
MINKNRHTTSLPLPHLPPEPTTNREETTQQSPPDSQWKTTRTELPWANTTQTRNAGKEKIHVLERENPKHPSSSKA